LAPPQQAAGPQLVLVNVMAPHAREDVLLNVFDQQLLAGQKPLLP
jgi:hypothetical protein